MRGDLKCFLDDNPSATHLEENCPVPVEPMTTKLVFNSTLLSLNLTNVHDHSASKIANSISHNVSLRDLQIHGPMIGVIGTRSLASSLILTTHLTTLTLYQTCGGANAVAAGLTHTTSLTSLSLFSINCGIKGAKAIADSLAVNTTLTALTLWDGDIGDEGAKALAVSLAYNDSLTGLFLGKNGIHNTGAAFLATHFLSHTPTLTTLDLTDNNLQDDGVIAILKSVPHNLSLMTLRINGNVDVPAWDCRQMLKIATTLTVLNSVSFTCFSVSRFTGMWSDQVQTTLDRFLTSDAAFMVLKRYLPVELALPTIVRWLNDKRYFSDKAVSRLYRLEENREWRTLLNCLRKDFLIQRTTRFPYVTSTG